MTLSLLAPAPAKQVADRAAPSIRLDSLTGLRFLAAVLVVIHHTVANDVHHGGLVSIPAIQPLATLGYTGVTFFFVLSGFVLAWSWSPRRPRADFWIRRAARVYPLHLMSWLISIPVLLTTGVGIGLFPAGLSLPLLQAWSPSSNIAFGMNGLSWSLSCEAFFYALFPLLIVRLVGRADAVLRLVAGASVGLIVAIPCAVYLLGGRRAIAVLYYFPPYRVLEFIIGICLALLVSRGWRPWLPSPLGVPAVVVNLGITIAAVKGYAHLGHGDALPRSVGALLMLPGYVLAIVSAAVTDIAGRKSLLSHRVLVLLGTWSFALYMTHLLLISGIEAAVGQSTLYRAHSAAATLCLVITGAVVISAVAYGQVERPLERWIRQRYTPVVRGRHRAGREMRIST